MKRKFPRSPVLRLINMAADVNTEHPAHYEDVSFDGTSHVCDPVGKSVLVHQVFRDPEGLEAHQKFAFPIYVEQSEEVCLCFWARLTSRLSR